MTSATDDQTRLPFVLEEAVGILASTPATVAALVQTLPAPWLISNEGGNSWSARDVVGHLIHADRTNWLVRARMILDAGDESTFADFERAGFADAIAGRTVISLLDEFSVVRRESVKTLIGLQLSDADLDRRGRHPAFGAVTLRQLLAAWVVHDYDHITQITRVLALQYRDEAGPWRAYLRVIRDVAPQ